MVGVAWLFTARAVQGLATGLALGTASAGLLDFHPRQDSEDVGLTNGVVSAAGLGLGALASSALVQFLPAPRVLPYVVVFILFAVALVGVILMPEPVASRSRPRLLPQRPHVPSSVRQHFVLAALAVISAYSIGGLSFALGPALFARVFESTNHLVTGTSLFLLPGVGAVAQLAYGRRTAWVGAATGAVALALGVGLIALSAQIPPAHRADLMSAFFIVACAALSIPAVLAGLVAGPLGLASTFEFLAAAVAAVALLVAVQAWRTRPRPVACTVRLVTDAA